MLKVFTRMNHVRVDASLDRRVPCTCRTYMQETETSNSGSMTRKEQPSGELLILHRAYICASEASPYKWRIGVSVVCDCHYTRLSNAGGREIMTNKLSGDYGK